MTQYHAVMLDECGQEFGASVEAVNKAQARELLMENYPENRGIEQLESPGDTDRRQADIYRRLDREQNGEFNDY